MMTPEEIQQVVEDYRKSSQNLNELEVKIGKFKFNTDNLGRLKRDKRGEEETEIKKKEEELETKKKEDKNDNVNLPNNGGKTDDKTEVKPTGGKPTGGTPTGGTPTGGTPTGGTPTGAQGTKTTSYNPNFKDINKYTSGNNIPTMKDFETPKNEIKKDKPKISPAKFSTSQRQTKGLVKSGELKDTDLNKFKRSNVYTANDGKTQVNRSTIFTKAAFDFGNVKKGQPLGVLTGSQRKKYDLQVANMNNKTKVEAYDLVLDYVLSEGHADTLDEAHYVMMQMDENTIQQIIEMSSPYTISQADVNARTPAFKNYQKGVKNKITGEPLYKLGSGVNLPKI